MHNQPLRFIKPLALILVIFVVGCSVINEEQCLQGDWHYIGYADGERGFYPNARLMEISEGCSAYGVTPDNEVYRDGHQLGLRRYCTAANGYLLGEDGKEINDLCPADLRTTFIQNYLAGLTLREQGFNAKLLQYSSAYDQFQREYNQLLAENAGADLLEEATDRLRYAGWMVAYYQFVLANTQGKISRWSEQVEY